MDKPTMRRKATQARVARVGTVDQQGRVHLVPVTFAVTDDVWYSPSDEGERQAKRLRNLARSPQVSILIDTYDEDWAKVWWVRLRGNGRVISSGTERDHAWRLLREKYPQFADTPPEEGRGPVMAVDIEQWTGWAYSQ